MFRLKDGTTPKGYISMIQPTPYQVLEHARMNNEMVPQTEREAAIPDHPVASTTPVDGAPELTDMMNADRPVLPVYPNSIPPYAVQQAKLPMKVK